MKFFKVLPKKKILRVHVKDLGNLTKILPEVDFLFHKSY